MSENEINGRFKIERMDGCSKLYHREPNGKLQWMATFHDIELARCTKRFLEGEEYEFKNNEEGNTNTSY